MGLDPRRLYHVAVMPCYDKKLEASRDDFAVELGGEEEAAPSRDADAVMREADDGEGNGEGAPDGAAGPGPGSAAAAGGGGPARRGAPPPTPPPVRVSEVDAVLTSAELLEILQRAFPTMSSEGAGGAGGGGPSEGPSGREGEAGEGAGGGATPGAPAAPPAPPFSLPSEYDDWPDAYGAAPGEREVGLFGVAGGAGGALECVFRHAARTLFGHDVPPGPLPFKAGRNADLREVSLELGGRRVLHFASAYGFRNIQNVVRRMKSGRCEYDYVEIMACPGACLNGGGQVKPAAGTTPRALLEALEVHYHAAEVQARPPEACPRAAALYRDVLGGGVGSPAARALLRTEYHARTPTPGLLIGSAALW